MKPKFEVGEMVILQSRAFPEYNGEYPVIEIRRTRGAVNAEGIHVFNGGFAYVLPVHHPEYEGWHELALRKKHLPGSLSFRDLMQTLKDPSKCLNA